MVGRMDAKKNQTFYDSTLIAQNKQTNKKPRMTGLISHFK